MLITQTSLQTILDKKIENNDVLVIILLYKNPNFVNIAKPYDIELFGKKMWKWVELACAGYEIKTTLFDDNMNLISLIKPMLTDKKYTLVLYSDTPLLTKNTINDIITYATSKMASAVNLPRGYIFETQYLKNIDEVKNSYVEGFNEKDFIVVDNLFLFEKVNSVMKNRILEYHMRSGVIIKDKQTTFIDADCVIESGVVIEPFNTLRGTTFIGANSYLSVGNILTNCSVGKGCYLENVVNEKTKINDNVKIKNLTKN